MAEIPPSLLKALQAVGTKRFIRVRKREKIPKDTGWQQPENQMLPDDRKLATWLQAGGNYGVVGGRGLIIIDADTEQLDRLLEKKLPPTFKVMSPGSKLPHRYYQSSLEDPIRLYDKEKTNVGDIQGKGKQGVGPGSTHPNGGKYRIIDDRPLAYLPEEKIREALAGWIVEPPRKETARIAQAETRDTDLRITDVLNQYGITLNEQGDELWGAHPVHGSTHRTGHNFWVNTRKNAWHCFRHDTGGGPFSLVAVMEGIIRCEEALPGALKGDRFLEVKKAAQEKGLIEPPFRLANWDELVRKNVPEEPEVEEITREIREKASDDDKLAWKCETMFVTFSSNITYEDGHKIKEKTTYELPKELAEKAIEKNLAFQHQWRCTECGETYNYKPSTCRNKECDNRRFNPLHPTEFYEIGDVLLDNYHFAVPMESMTESKPGLIHIYKNGVYRHEKAKAIIRAKVKKMQHTSKQALQKHVIDHIATLTSIPENQFGIHEPKVVLKKETLNLDTMETSPHSPEQLAMARIPVEYNPKAKCIKFREHLKNTIPQKEDRTNIQEALGTTLIAQKLHKKGIILVGPTDAGKTTFIKIISGVIGHENVSSQTLYSLTRTRWGKAKLRGNLLNAVNETGGYLKNLFIIKRIFDGNKVDAEHKGEKTFEYSPTCEHVYTANQTPTADRKDDAFWNRWIVAITPNQIPEDKQDREFPQKVVQEEHQGILNWLIEGYHRFMDNNKRFTNPIDWEEMRDKWLEWGDSIQRFIQHRLTREPGNKISTNELHDKYTDYALSLDMDVQSQHKLTSEIKKLGYAQYSKSIRFEGGSTSGFRDIKVTQPQEKPQEKPQKNLHRNLYKVLQTVKNLENKDKENKARNEKIFSTLKKEHDIEKKEAKKLLGILSTEGMIYRRPGYYKTT